MIKGTIKMKCILKDNYGEEQFNSIKEAIDSAVVKWEYRKAVPECIKRLDGTVMKTEEELYKIYQKWWEEIYGF